MLQSCIFPSPHDDWSVELSITPIFKLSFFFLLRPFLSISAPSLCAKWSIWTRRSFSTYFIVRVKCLHRSYFIYYFGNVNGYMPFSWSFPFLNWKLLGVCCNFLSRGKHFKLVFCFLFWQAETRMTFRLLFTLQIKKRKEKRKKLHRSHEMCQDTCTSNSIPRSNLWNIEVGKVWLCAEIKGIANSVEVYVCARTMDPISPLRFNCHHLIRAFAYKFI